ncbi:MAG: hypothetical protein NTAFB01_13410 [Nitrospira sp.]
MTKRLLTVALLAISLAEAAHGQTLEWDRNSEPDMQDYLIWVCQTPGCVVAPSSATFKGTVPQTPEGKAPTWPIPATFVGKPGAVAISARDKSGNRSALSVQLPFDTTAPAVPTNPRMK